MSNASCAIDRRTHVEQLWDKTEDLSPCAEFTAKGGLVLGALLTLPLHSFDFAGRRLLGACGVKIEDRWMHASLINLAQERSIRVALPGSFKPITSPLQPKPAGESGSSFDTKSHSKEPVKKVAWSASESDAIETKRPSEDEGTALTAWVSKRGVITLDTPEKVFEEAMAQVSSMFGPLAGLIRAGLYHDGLLPPIRAFLVDGASQAPQNVEQIPVAMKTLAERSAALAIGSTYPNPARALLRSQDGVYLGQYASVVTAGIQGHESEITYAAVRKAQLLVGSYVAALIDTIGATQATPCAFLQKNHEVLLGMIAEAVKSLTNASAEACFVAVADYQDGTAVFGVGDCAARLVCNTKGERSVVAFAAQPEGAASMALGGRAQWLPAYQFQVVGHVERILLASDGVLQAEAGLVDLGMGTKQGMEQGVVAGAGVGAGPSGSKLPGGVVDRNKDSKDVEESDFFASGKPKIATRRLDPKAFCEASVAGARDMVYNALSEQAAVLRFVSSHKQLESLRAADPESPILIFLDKASNDSKALPTGALNHVQLRAQAGVYLQNLIVLGNKERGDLTKAGLKIDTLNEMIVMVQQGMEIPEVMAGLDYAQDPTLKNPLQAYLGRCLAVFNVHSAVDRVLKAVGQAPIDRRTVTTAAKKELGKPLSSLLDDFAMVVRVMAHAK